jgi:hypothetical protein
MFAMDYLDFTIDKSMITFKEFLESMATKAGTPTLKSGGGGIDDIDTGDGGGGDDDGEWEWDKLSRFDRQLTEWCNTSPFARKIKNKIFEMIFKTKPEIDLKEHLPDEEVDDPSFAPTGEIVISVEWKLPVETIDERIHATLKMSGSDLWKPLGVRPDELWHTLDKGDMSDYVWYHIKASMLGQNVEYYKHYHPERPDGKKLDPEYFPLQRGWEKDKPTFDKYTKYMLHEMAKDLEEKALEFIPFEATIERTRESVNALIWNDNFDASAYITYRYKRS